MEIIYLITRQKTKRRNALENNIPTDIRLPKAQISKNSIWRIFGSLLSKVTGPLIKVAVPIGKNILAPLGIAAAASAIDAGIQKKIHGSEQQLQ